ncbi:MAG: hypothetical protein H0T79_08540, partial [Deltaproteobacteria bacterium]|nr:hypothetical protein [Deltaproteobacteria bacterium]
MVRVVLLGLLAVAATGCGSSSSEGPAVMAGVTVGSVVELAGTVTATRGGQLRTLKAGAEVSGDDVIATAADGSVAIELQHNGARWSLGSGKQARVSESVAWSLPRATGQAAAVAHDTSAAGRHAERPSAETA